MWRPQVERLGDCHCLVPDLPEQGQSPASPPFSLEEAARQVATLIRERVPEGRAHVVGLSLGGAVALEVLRTEPERLRSVFVTGTSARLGRVLGMISLASASLTRVLGPERLAELSLRQFAIPPEYQDIVREDLVRGCEEPFLRHVTQALMAQRLPTRATVPTLVAVGERETLPARRAARTLVATLTGARGVQVPSLGHVWNLQAPDLFTALVRAWSTGAPLPEGLTSL
ncbi:hypothetical protein MEBOL_003571 [Melittangium boletus DSM 14713]|uniref:AB hydrolase-1 domain-containing protein n=2 Tax=Melittangium boletus TaxID=83453 RepID=A0A250IGQ6_9BACT|nr:hypothetical protein MEBOL_003571 [Melittangium boletus DSM 14713]